MKILHNTTPTKCKRIGSDGTTKRECGRKGMNEGNFAEVDGVVLVSGNI